MENPDRNVGVFLCGENLVALIVPREFYFLNTNAIYEFPKWKIVSHQYNCLRHYFKKSNLIFLHL